MNPLFFLLIIHLLLNVNLKVNLQNSSHALRVIWTELSDSAYHYECDTNISIAYISYHIYFEFCINII